MTTQSNQRLQNTFQRLAGRAALVPYVTAGDPVPRVSVPLMHALVDSGADIIELGVPFSDPMADGPVIQRAAERALSKGMTLHKVLDMVRELDRKSTRLNSSHVAISYAVFCLKKKKSDTR